MPLRSNTENHWGLFSAARTPISETAWLTAVEKLATSSWRRYCPLISSRIIAVFMGLIGGGSMESMYSARVG